MDALLELSVPSRTEYIAVVRLVVASLVSARRSVADERIDDLKLAVSEACTNAMEANLASPVADPRVVVKVWEAPERLEVCITDSGDRVRPRRAARSTHRSPTPTGSTSSAVSASR